MYREKWVILGSAAATGALLAAEHRLLWRHREEISRPEAYVIGVATIGIGITAAAVLLDDWRVAETFWATAGIGGAAVAGSYWWRSIDQRVAARLIADRALRKINERLSGGLPGARGH